MELLTAVNSRLSRWAMYWAVACIAGIIVTVVFGVVRRYVFNDAPSYVEAVALLLVINVAFFGAAAGVRDEGHIGMESLVVLLPKSAQYWVGHIVGGFTLLFAGVLIYGGSMMAESVYTSSIPTLGISEAWRYAPSTIGGVLIALFAIEHIFAAILGKEVKPSWN